VAARPATPAEAAMSHPAYTHPTPVQLPLALARTTDQDRDDVGPA
jgi:hypothetical protein